MVAVTSSGYWGKRRGCGCQSRWGHCTRVRGEAAIVNVIVVGEQSIGSEEAAVTHNLTIDIQYKCQARLGSRRTLFTVGGHTNSTRRMQRNGLANLSAPS